MQVLDHGFVNLVESWGSDERIIEAARMSTDKGFQGWGDFITCNYCQGSSLVYSHFDAQLKDAIHVACPQCKGKGGTGTKGDEKLLAYLYRNNHATPFEMAGAIIEVQAPIFVFREWHRHRTQSYNELSARYTPMPDLNYIPSIERLMINAGTTNKQAGTVKDSESLTEETAEGFRMVLQERYEDQQCCYESALKAGVPKELARLVIPVGRYSRMRASANLRNWLGFLTLRMAPQAQWEIRQYADAVHSLLEPLFPRTLALFNEGK